MTVKPSLALIVVCLTICPAFERAAAKAPTTIIVNKCCPLGYRLNANRECTTAGTTEHWWPIVYLVKKGDYYEPKGDAPRFLKPRENVRPTCEAPELIGSPHALLSNGTLYLSDRFKFIDTENFCVDHDTALICEPATAENAKLITDTQNRTLLRKCCSPHELYDAHTKCVRGPATDWATVKLIENPSDHVEYRYGVPQCNGVSHNIAVVGKLNETALDLRTGHLTLAEGIFRSDQFCLEHVNDTNAINVHVFTCAEYLPATHLVRPLCQLADSYLASRMRSESICIITAAKHASDHA